MQGTSPYIYAGYMASCSRCQRHLSCSWLLQCEFAISTPRLREPRQSRSIINQAGSEDGTTQRPPLMGPAAQRRGSSAAARPVIFFDLPFIQKLLKTDVNLEQLVWCPACDGAGCSDAPLVLDSPAKLRRYDFVRIHNAVQVKQLLDLPHHVNGCLRL